MAILSSTGLPSATPSLTPWTNSTSSSSFLGVPMPPVGFLSAISSATLSMSILNPAGTPSSIPPTKGPWLFPNNVNLNFSPVEYIR